MDEYEEKELNERHGMEIYELEKERDILRVRVEEAERRGDEWFRATAVLHDRANQAEAERDRLVTALRDLLDAPKRPDAAQRRWERYGNTADAALLDKWQTAHGAILAAARAALSSVSDEKKEG